jgi:uncharacterized repeat protein (TIGR03803 family)
VSLQSRVGARLGAFFGTSLLLTGFGMGSAAAYTETTLHTFCSAPKCADGSQPGGELVADQGGNYYGTAGLRGKFGAGVVFEYEAGTGQYKVIHSFCKKAGCPDGKDPYRVKLVIDTAGNLYGTTFAGGDNGSNDIEGVVFELVRGNSSWREKILHTFCARHDCIDGYNPHDGLTYLGAAAGEPYDGTSPLYGTTYLGGANSNGTVFSLSPKAGTEKWTEQVLYSFCSSVGCTDGEEPDTPLYVDSAGNIYGTTFFGGQVNTAGVVFELSPGETGYSESVLYSFCAQTNCVDGEDPYGGLVMDGAGNLFGTAGNGGSAGLGVLFELSPNGSQWDYSVLDNFNGQNGAGPTGAMIFGSDGNLYGTTYGGGTNNHGTVFTFNGSIQNLYSFFCTSAGCPDGKAPFAGVVQDSAGNLFGTAQLGGHKNGTLYELSP